MTESRLEMLALATAALALPGHEEQVQQNILEAFELGRGIGEMQGENTETFHGVSLEPEDEADLDYAETH